MNQMNSSTAPSRAHAWPLVLCLVGVDYFSTLAYLPSMAVEAAGSLAPIAAAGVVLVTFVLALPIYWYVVGRSSDGRGATGLLEDLTPGWRGKMIVLTLLGFAAADFVITRSLSLADAAIHLIHNPHGQRLLERLPQTFLGEDPASWSWWERAASLVMAPQVAVTLGLSIVSFGLWQLIKNGLSRRMLWTTAVATVLYLGLVAIVVVSGIVYLGRHPEIISDELAVLRFDDGDAAASVSLGWRWEWVQIILWSFPQMALGLSGFEMLMTVAPQVAGNANDSPKHPRGRIRNTRKLMLTAAIIMSVYLVSAVTVTSMLAPRSALAPGGAAEHRALAYLAHGSPLANGEPGSALNPLFSHDFGDLFDLSTAFVLCLAGISVTLGLKNLLPHYLHRLGMEIGWAGKVGAILHLLNVIILVVTVVFHASPASLQWAYATSVLVLLAGAAIAASRDLFSRRPRTIRRVAGGSAAAIGAGLFLALTGITLLINHSGITIALAFVTAIVLSSFISRWIRSTELRFEGFDFANEHSQTRWRELSKRGPRVLAPHRPGLMSLADRRHALLRDYRLAADEAVLFVEVTLGDPSDFYQRPLMRVECEENVEVLRVSHCVSVAHVLAAICLEMCDDETPPPEIVFGWSNEAPLAANLNFLLLGEGNVPWMVRELVLNAGLPAHRQPRILIG
ncbi:hypothetical protein PLANPX_4335 [Lacipirellula parvula]|uniref:Amino acid transporter n=2 Tax=Lacipirellula parvula TaxID=2650471 RepID=A0A5K7XKC6_9BACT|nr:hypothetical protein PLANPX_4335 [Lacipirellula parvula]